MRRYIQYIIYIAVVMAIGTACSTQQQQTSIYVTIPPLKQIVEEIVGDDFEVKVVLPQGASPETFELSARQMAEISSARWIFATSLLDFENAIVKRIGERANVVNISRNIELIGGSCSHCHNHGADPHIWASPRSLICIAQNVFDAIAEELPDSTKYGERFAVLGARLLDLDEECRELCKTAQTPYFIIYHPALTYLARDYGLEQIAIEDNGKEAGLKRMAEIIDRARKDGIKQILYQREFPRSSVETICNDIGAEPVEIDPLAEDCIENIRNILKQICQ